MMEDGNSQKSGRRFRWLPRSIRQYWLIMLLFSFVILFRFEHFFPGHQKAATCIKAMGGIFIHGFEEPMGPNWIYISGGSIPPNGFFPNWFVHRFCISGTFTLEFENSSLRTSDLECLSDLLFLQEIQFIGCEFSGSSKSKFAVCKNLYYVTFMSAKFHKGSLVILDSMRHVKDFTFLNSDFGDQKSSLVDRICEFKSLETLYFLNCDILESDVTRIRGCFPNCNLTIEEDSNWKAL